MSSLRKEIFLKNVRSCGCGQQVPARSGGGDRCSGAQHTVDTSIVRLFRIIASNDSSPWWYCRLLLACDRIFSTALPLCGKITGKIPTLAVSSKTRQWRHEIAKECSLTFITTLYVAGYALRGKSVTVRTILCPVLRTGPLVRTLPFFSLKS